MENSLLILLPYLRIYSEPRLLYENREEVSKVDYSSKAKSCNFRYCVFAIGTVSTLDKPRSNKEDCVTKHVTSSTKN